MANTTKIYDIIIIGSGPAGYTAAIYGVRAGLSTLVLEGVNYGGQLVNTVDIENYPGFKDPVNGGELMEAMRDQVSNLGGELLPINVTKVNLLGKVKEVYTAEGEFKCKTVIIATGATAKLLNIKGHDAFWGKGISACAVCDGALPYYRNEIVAVIGGGDTACEEALYLSRFVNKVYVLVRSGTMRASYRNHEKLLANKKIQIMYNTEAIEATGEKSLEKITIVNKQKDITDTLVVKGLFYAIGHTPNTAFLDKSLTTDAHGYLITNNTKTNIEGVFACGDVQDPKYRQAITAAASGCIAALEAYDYLS